MTVSLPSNTAVAALSSENPDIPREPANPTSAANNPTYYRAGSANQFLVPMLKPGKSDIIFTGLEDLQNIAVQQYTHRKNDMLPMLGISPENLPQQKQTPFASPIPPVAYQREDAWLEPQMLVVAP